MSLLFSLIFSFVAHADMNHLGRIRNFDRPPNSSLNFDIQDSGIWSPKSVLFSKDGEKVYVNSLEGGVTLVYRVSDFQKLKSISHRYSNQGLFPKVKTGYAHQFDKKVMTRQKDDFWGKPVEMGLSSDGRWLWIPYYRRNHDASAQGPSAVAVIDTQTDKIVQVFATGPIPKFVAMSPDGNFVAVTNWGDNTINLFDTSSGDPKTYKALDTLVVESVLDQNNLGGTNRDSSCGFCLRGTLFTKDSSYLLVGRMGGGGIAGFDMQTKKYLGTVWGMAPTPRHLILSEDGDDLIVTSNYSGVISKAPVDQVIRYLKKSLSLEWESVDLGRGARTVDQSADGQFLFVAMNNDQKITMLDAETLEILEELLVDPYPVGLAVSPVDNLIAVTSQGRKGRGGNAVNFFSFD